MLTIFNINRHALNRHGVKPNRKGALWIEANLRALKPRFYN